MTRLVADIPPAPAPIRSAPPDEGMRYTTRTAPDAAASERRRADWVARGFHRDPRIRGRMRAIVMLIAVGLVTWAAYALAG